MRVPVCPKKGLKRASIAIVTRNRSWFRRVRAYALVVSAVAT